MAQLFSLRTGLAAAAALLAFPAAAQGPFTGKPIYTIEARRQGTTMGTITVEMFPRIAPRHVRNFDSLVAHLFYDSTAFHRVVPGFVIQGGDPNSRHGPRSTWGFGQPGQPTVNAEFSAISHQRGIFSAARSSDPNSADSQFFICVAAATHLDGNYSAYGRVTAGMSVVDQIVSAPRDANDNPIQKIEMFVRRAGSNDSVPAVPAIVYPTAGTQGVAETPSLQWGRVHDAMIYHVQVASDSAFTQLQYDEQVSQVDLSYTLAPLTPSTTYYWRVQANNGGHLSGFSPGARFTTGMAAPALTAPANNSTGQAGAPLLQWQAAPAATAYRVQISRGIQFQANQIVLDQDSIAGTSFQVPAPGLMANTRYFWRVRAVSNGAQGFWSAPWNFRTTVSGVGSELAKADLLGQNVPNPAEEETVIPYRLMVGGPVRLVLYDALGRVAARLVEAGWKTPGAHSVRVATGRLQPGVYLYRLETPDGVVARRMMVR